MKNTAAWIIADKPEGMLSRKLTSLIRRLFRASKAGHAGTLDPLATGLLPIALGDATKTIPFLVNAGKTYRFTLQWGTATETDDAEGRIVSSSSQRPSPQEIHDALPNFTGEIMQRPPIFSAVKCQGTRAYRLARAGEKPSLPPRPVRVDHLRLLHCPSPHHAEIEARCGKGVYIRSLARDLGLSLGTFAHIRSLRRTQIGPFDEKDAISLDKLIQINHNDDSSADCLLPLTAVLGHLPSLTVGPETAGRLRQGRRVALNPPFLTAEAESILILQEGEAVALAHWIQGALQPRRVFAPTALTGETTRHE